MVTAFLPCRAGSQRVPNKNTKDFAGISGGLLKIKIHQLIDCKSIDTIVLSSNDDKVFKVASEINSEKIKFDQRPEKLATSATSTDEIVEYVSKIIDAPHILWTHVTSPFITSDVYENAIQKYFSLLNESDYDSLMSVSKIQTFLWNENNEPLNYDRKVEKWPRTQTLPPVYEINSGFFLSSKENYLKFNDRIGDKPFLYETEKKASFDIDWPEDFELAEMMFKQEESID